jgi:hypothetical protein
MTLDVVPYMAAAVTAHSLFLSVGGLMSVNAIRALAERQKDSWDFYVQTKGRPSRATSLNGRFDAIKAGKQKKNIRKLMTANLLCGLFGIIYALVIIGFLAPKRLVLTTLDLAHYDSGHCVRGHNPRCNGLCGIMDGKA